jgi:hypothetical protein
VEFSRRYASVIGGTGLLSLSIKGDGKNLITGDPNSTANQSGGGVAGRQRAMPAAGLAREQHLHVINCCVPGVGLLLSGYLAQMLGIRQSLSPAPVLLP